jgi:NADH-quinone oxidoreductase subunit M
MTSVPWITLLTLVPLVGGGLSLCLPDAQKRLARNLGLAFALVSLGLVLAVWAGFDSNNGALQLEESHEWIPTLAVRYHVGIDGLSLLMLLLSALVVPMALLASWKIEERVPIYFGLVLLLEAGLFGTFTALNFVHWFLFWELSLIPAFFLIKLWGGRMRSAAATQFFVYTMVGSVALLLSFLAIFLATNRFDFVDLAELGRNGTLVSALSNLGWRELTSKWMATVIFCGALLGFAVKVPLVPFHTWLPTAYAEAPTGTTMLLTGLMSKMGVYGFLRILVPIFPQEMRWVLTPLLWLAAISIVFSAGAAFAQRDLKRVLAYSSINHLGYCLLGIFAVMNSGLALATPGVEKTAALNGVFLQMFNHGLTAAALFWFVGMIEERGHGLRGLEDFGGLRKVAPIFCGLMGIALFSSLGLPGLNGFIGEFLIFKGAFPLASGVTAVAVLGLLITAIFILTILQRVFNGPLNARWAGFPDLSLQERVLVAPAIALMFILGIYPQLLLGFVNSTVMEMVKHLRF